MTAAQFMRKLHNYLTPLVMIPLLIMTITGMILMFKKQSEWIQPPTVRGQGSTPELFFETMLDTLKTVPDGEVNSWEDIDRIDVRPGKGVAKVQLENRLEVQLDLQTGEVLQVMYRRSDIIEDLHTGGYWGDFVKYGIFLTASLALLIQLVTGVYLFFKVFSTKMRNRKKLLEEAMSVEVKS